MRMISDQPGRGFRQSSRRFSASIVMLAGLAGAGFSFRATMVRADDVIYIADESNTFRGHFNQLAQENGQYLLNNPTQACGPTSVANSFVYLADLGVTGLGGDDEAISYDTINTLSDYMSLGANGTTVENFVKGKEQFLEDNAEYITQNGKPVAIQTVGQSAPNGGYSQAANGPWIGGVQETIPTAEFIEQQLAAGEDVEMLFQWSDDEGNFKGGGHWVNVYGINYDETENDGTISFVDPENYDNGTGSAQALTSESLYELVDGYLAFGYKGGASGVAADDDMSGASYGVITDVIAESPVPVPEPTMLLLAAISAGALLRRRREAPHRAGQI